MRAILTQEVGAPSLDVDLTSRQICIGATYSVPTEPAVPLSIDGRALALSYARATGIDIVVPGAVTNVDLDARDLSGSWYSRATALGVTNETGMDEAGWTTIVVAPTTQQVYVSSSTGSDTNTGLATNNAMATINAGLALMRDGFPDHLYLRRGDTWQGGTLVLHGDQGFNGAGPEISNRMVFTAFGPETDPMPVLYPTGSTGIIYDRGARNLIIAHIEANGSNHHPSPPPGVRALTSADITPGGESSFVLIEGCKLGNGFRAGINITGNSANVHHDITLRRNIVYDNYAQAPARSQGAFLTQTSNLLIESNVFDRNGWHPTYAPVRGVGNHNLYVTQDARNVTFRGNISTRASLTGIQMRPGGQCELNFYQGNPQQLTFGIVRGGGNPVPGGVTGYIRNCVFVEPHNLRGTQMLVGNIASCSISNNISANFLTGNGAWSYNFDSDIDGTDEVDVGINNMTFRNNIGYYSAGINLESGFRNDFPDTGLTTQEDAIDNYNNCLFISNVIEVVRDGGIIEQNFAVSAPNNATIPAANIIMTNNTYESPNAEAQRFRRAGDFDFDYLGVPGDEALEWMSFTTWQGLGVDSASMTNSTPTVYTDPDRNLETWVDVVESTSGTTIDGALSNYLRLQRRGSWNSNYQAPNIINHVREGFDWDPV